MSELTHYIGGKHVNGTSGRFADVYNPATGEVQAKTPLASQAELDAAVANAAAAQPAWAATNPQKRARVLMKFVDLLHRDMDKLAEALSREHGKTIPDAKGDIIRGLEVAEFCFGAPHLLKGEFTEGAGPGIDMYSLRQPLGVVAGITPFNFPAMIPMWKFCPAIAAGNAFILKPSERDPSVPLMLAELMTEAGLPDGILNVVNGDKQAVDAILDHEDIMAIGFVGSTPIAQYIYSRGCANGKRVQCFGGAKNHMIIMPDADMDQAADALVGQAERRLSGEALDDRVIADCLAPLWEDPALDTVVLGCTHFPLLTQALDAAAPRPITWVDSGDAIARRLAQVVAPLPRAEATGSEGPGAAWATAPSVSLAAVLAGYGFAAPRTLRVDVAAT